MYLVDIKTLHLLAIIILEGHTIINNNNNYDSNK